MKTNDNGRYWVIDKKTGRKFCVETISDRDQKVTDQTFKNGVSDGVSRTEGTKWHSEAQGGSIREEDSIITGENGFKKIWNLPTGTSPDGFIEALCKS